MLLRPLRGPAEAIHFLAPFDPIVRRALAECTAAIAAPETGEAGPVQAKGRLMDYRPSVEAQKRVLDAIDVGVCITSEIASAVRSSRGRTSQLLRHLQTKGLIRGVVQGHTVIWSRAAADGVELSGPPKLPFARRPGTSRKLAVLAVLLDKPLEPLEMAALVNEDEVSSRLGAAKRQGLAKQIGKGTGKAFIWSLTSKGRQVVQAWIEAGRP
jgi:hypothetical protein